MKFVIKLGNKEESSSVTTNGNRLPGLGDISISIFFTLEKRKCNFLRKMGIADVEIL